MRYSHAAHKQRKTKMERSGIDTKGHTRAAYETYMREHNIPKPEHAPNLLYLADAILAWEEKGKVRRQRAHKERQGGKKKRRGEDQP